MLTILIFQVSLSASSIERVKSLPYMLGKSRIYWCSYTELPQDFPREILLCLSFLTVFQCDGRITDPQTAAQPRCAPKWMDEKKKRSLRASTCFESATKVSRRSKWRGSSRGSAFKILEWNVEMGQAVEGNVFILGKPRRPPESKHVIEFKPMVQTRAFADFLLHRPSIRRVCITSGSALHHSRSGWVLGTQYDPVFERRVDGLRSPSFRDV